MNSGSKKDVLLRIEAGELTVGTVPRVVGTLSDFNYKGGFPCDIVEVRLDRMARTEDWVTRCVGIQREGKPVLLTARLALEGGAWKTDDDERLKIYHEALRNLAAVDVELASGLCGEIAAEAARLGKACVVSFHDFQKTPPLSVLGKIVERQHAVGSIAKVSTMIHGESDAEILRSLLAKSWPKPLCVIGMGEAWPKTRVEFATLGSCLTYGYLDGSAAPGQWHASELSRQVKLAAATG